MENFKTTEPYVIRDLEILRIVADPLRFQIIEALIQQALTVKQLAQQLGLAPSKLYYHINLLESHGIIQVVETRMVVNMIEKLYRTTAPSLTIDPNLFATNTGSNQDMVTNAITMAIDATREDMLRTVQMRLTERDQGVEEQPLTMLTLRKISRISEARAETFRARLNALLSEFEAAGAEPHDADETLQKYALMIAFYPSLYFKDER